MNIGNILTAKVSIRGIRPLLWHRFGPDAIPLEKGEKTGVAGNNPEEWKKTYLADAEGRLYLEPTYLFGAIRDGSKQVKKGRGSIQSDVASTLQVMDDRVFTDRSMPEGDPVQDPSLPVFLHVCSVRNPATKGRNVRYRVAASVGWECSFSIMWDRTIVSRDQMRDALRFAGQLCGLGDGRSIGFGRFEVTNFEVDGG